MSYQNIAVVLDDSSHSPARLQFAIKLAKEHGARLTALHLSNAPFNPALTYELMQPLFAQYLESAITRQQQAHDEFIDLMHTAGISHDWIGGNSYDSQTAIAFSRSADLIIAGQHDNHDASCYLGDSFLSQLLLKAGRPVLITPRFAEPVANFSTILIAWDGGRNAARAVSDALPLLIHADTIKVLSVTREYSTSAEQKLTKTTISNFLQHHQLHAEVIEHAAGIHVGGWLLDRAEALDLHADLMVAGVGGISVFKDSHLGGVTRFLLHKTTVPLFLSC